jgi:hypothetical protein
MDEYLEKLEIQHRQKDKDSTVWKRCRGAACQGILGKMNSKESVFTSIWVLESMHSNENDSAKYP